MVFLTTDDPGYESDTGPRSNPTVSNFENNRPVETVMGQVQGGRAARQMNRKGRAIARIVHSDPQWESIANISYIFNVGHDCIKRAVQNNYSPPDDALKDYEKVEKEFRDKFPPELHALRWANQSVIQVEKRASAERVETKGANRPVKRSRYQKDGATTESEQRVGKPTQPLLASKQLEGTVPRNQVTRAIPRTPSDDPCEQLVPIAAGVPLKEQVARVIVLVPRLPPQEQRGPAFAGVPPDTLPAFLTNVMGADLSKHLPIFDAKGFKNFDLLRALTRLDNENLRDTLRRLFAHDVESREDEGLTGLELVSLELAIRKLPREQRVPAGTLTSLPGFLKNIFGIDFTEHLPLFYAKGFRDPNGQEVEVLVMIAGLDATILRGLLKNLLGRHGPSTDGLTDVELVLVELAILGLHN